MYPFVHKEAQIPVQVIRRRLDKRKAGGKEWWSEKERRQAVASYLLLGKITLVVAATGIPEVTLRKWKAAPWWKEAEEEFRRGSKIELSGKLSTIVNKTLVALEDRVSNGDFVYNPKTGEYDRKPITAAVANKITNDLIEKATKLEDQALSEKLTDEGLDKRLLKLKNEMEKFAKAKTIEGTAHVQEPSAMDQVVVFATEGSTESGTTGATGDSHPHYRQPAHRSDESAAANG